MTNHRRMSEGEAALKGLLGLIIIMVVGYFLPISHTPISETEQWQADNSSSENLHAQIVRSLETRQGQSAIQNMNSEDAVIWGLAANRADVLNSAFRHQEYRTDEYVVSRPIGTEFADGSVVFYIIIGTQVRTRYDSRVSPHILAQEPTYYIFSRGGAGLLARASASGPTKIERSVNYSDQWQEMSALEAHKNRNLVKNLRATLRSKLADEMEDDDE